MFAVNVLLEKLLDGRTTAVPDAGALLLNHLSKAGWTPRHFSTILWCFCLLLIPLLDTSPRSLCAHFKNDYDSVDDVVSGLQALLERNPPTLEPGRPQSADRVRDSGSEGR